jgi:hypothetical protein
MKGINSFCYCSFIIRAVQCADNLSCADRWWRKLCLTKPVGQTRPQAQVDTDRSFHLEHHSPLDSNRSRAVVAACPLPNWNGIFHPSYPQCDGLRIWLSATPMKSSPPPEGEVRVELGFVQQSSTMRKNHLQSGSQIELYHYHLVEKSCGDA